MCCYSTALLHAEYIFNRPCLFAIYSTKCHANLTLDGHIYIVMEDLLYNQSILLNPAAFTVFFSV